MNERVDAAARSAGGREGGVSESRGCQGSCPRDSRRKASGQSWAGLGPSSAFVPEVGGRSPCSGRGGNRACGTGVPIDRPGGDLPEYTWWMAERIAASPASLGDSQADCPAPDGDPGGLGEYACDRC